jgi:hypothetical protein
MASCIGMSHPAGGPSLAFRLDPGRAKAAAGFDYFAIGVPDHNALDALAAHLDTLGEPHGGVHRASSGWTLPYLHDQHLNTERAQPGRITRLAEVARCSNMYQPQLGPSTSPR